MFSFFRPGQTIVIREIWQDKLWSLRPEIVVRDTPDLLSLYMPPGTVWKQPKAPDGQRATVVHRARSEWMLKTVPWQDYYRLRLTIPGADYSVLIFWDPPDMKQHSWYVNLEDPLHRTALGFDFLDQFLDIIIKPDLSAWHWKDEDELAEAVALGAVSKERAAAMRAEGEKVVAWLQSGKSPFNGWEKWRPDPSWVTPVLPAGWDVIQH
jgi:predicted RNA-binding protein associated with RNAse of E/G family